MNLERKNVLLYILILLGSSLAIIQYVFDRNLWFDEIMLARNIIGRSYAELMLPLDAWQAAPILFLQIEKFFSTLFYGGYGLRIFPLISFISSLFLFTFILKKIFDSFFIVFFALSLFALNSSFLYYSSEIKQYMSDVFVTLSLFSLTLSIQKWSLRDYLLLSIIGMISICLSNVTVVTLSCTGLYLIYNHQKIRTLKITNLIAVFFSWAAIFATYYYFFINNHPAKPYMLSFWEENGGFMTLNPSDPKFHKFSNKVATVFNCIFRTGTIVRFLIIGIFATGILSFYRKRKYDLLALFVAPVIIHLALSAMKMYPYERRLVLYTIPGMIICISEGSYLYLKYLSKIFKNDIVYKIVFIIPLLQLYTLFKYGFPINKDHMSISTKDGILFKYEYPIIKNNYKEQVIDEKYRLYKNKKP